MENKTRKILVADDEIDILEILAFNLRREGYEVITAGDGNDALEKANSMHPELIILDVMMPYKSGLDVCRILRANSAFNQTLIVMLTALNDDTSHIIGLEAGADDYITKPVSTNVLVSRVNALFRRLGQENEENKVITFGEQITIDPSRFVVIINEQEVVLAKKEFELLYLLATKPKRVFLRNEILNRVWGKEVIVGDRTIDVHVRKIRQKLGLDCITTVKGVGYKFDI